MTTTVAAVGVSAGTLVHAVALVLHEGVEVAAITTLARVEGLAPGVARARLAAASLVLGGTFAVDTEPVMVLGGALLADPVVVLGAALVVPANNLGTTFTGLCSPHLGATLTSDTLSLLLLTPALAGPLGVALSLDATLLGLVSPLLALGVLLLGLELGSLLLGGTFTLLGSCDAARVLALALADTAGAVQTGAVGTDTTEMRLAATLGGLVVAAAAAHAVHTAHTAVAPTTANTLASTATTLDELDGLAETCVARHLAHLLRLSGHAGHLSRDILLHHVSGLAAAALHTRGHGDTLALAAHAVALGLALGEGELATPELVTTTVAAVGVSAGTLVHAVALVLHEGVEVALVTTLANVEGLAPATAGVASTTTTRSSTTTIALHSSGHGDTLAAVAHAVALGLARGEGEAATPEAMTTTVAAVGVSAGTLVHAVALVLHEGVEVAAITTLARVEG